MAPRGRQPLLRGPPGRPTRLSIHRGRISSPPGPQRRPLGSQSKAAPPAGNTTTRRRRPPRRPPTTAAARGRASGGGRRARAIPLTGEGQAKRIKRRRPGCGCFPRDRSRRRHRHRFRRLAVTCPGTPTPSSCAGRRSSIPPWRRRWSDAPGNSSRTARTRRLGPARRSRPTPAARPAGMEPKERRSAQPPLPRIRAMVPSATIRDPAPVRTRPANPGAAPRSSRRREVEPIPRASAPTNGGISIRAATTSGAAKPRHPGEN